MTSVGVIFSAVEGINCLKEVAANQQESLPGETEHLLVGLKQVKELLAAAYDRKAEAKFAEEEKEAVQLSYEIVDAIADASSLKPTKDKLIPSLLHRKKPAGNTKQLLSELQQRLTDLQGQLAETGPRRVTTAETNDRPLQSQKSSSFFSRMKSPKSSKEVPAGGSSPQRIPKKVDRKHPEASLTRSERVLTGLRIEEQESPQRSSGSSVPEEPDVTAGPEKDPIKREELLNLLTQKLMEADSSSEVYLVGKSGMGKTTLARKLFQDDQLRNFFKSFAWLPITRNFQIKKVFQLLLQQLGPGPGAELEMSEIDLIPRIFARLKDRPYLLVLDDIESMDDWESIRLALPTSKFGKVIITTSSMDIARDRGEQRHLISGLHETEIIALFKDQAASISDEVRKVIFDISCGSPLLATILGKSLQSNVEGKLVGELRSYDFPSVRGTPQVLEASYERLGHEVKPHLLYLCQFPAGQDVDIDKLYLLLAAENLIKEETNITPQSLGEYLQKLNDLKLVIVQEDHILPKRGFYKSCKLHDQVWKFCRSKASEEEFLQIVDYGSSTPEKIGPNTRRLALYLRGDAGAASQSISQDTLKKLWSLAIVDTFEKKSEWPSELNDLTDSGYLRILNFDGVDFGVDRGLPKGLDKLVLLKYLSFRGCRLEELPSSLTNLALLETLDLLVRDDCTMVIPNNIFASKKRMMHLYFPRKYRRSVEDGKPKLELQCMERLQTLINFDTAAYDVEALNKLKNLKIFSATSKGSLGSELFQFLTQESGKKLQYSAVDITSFDRYDSGSLSELEKLLSCPSVKSVHVEGRIGKLATEEKEKDMSHAETIEEIVLDGSQLQTDPMTYLGEFQNLHRLVLSNDAFLGAEITISDPLFPNLRSLRLHNLKLLKKLTILKDAVPKLSALQIHSCASLSELSIPKELHNRLKQAHVENGGGAYSITPFPSVFKTTPSPFVFGRSS